MRITTAGSLLVALILAGCGVGSSATTITNARSSGGASEAGAHAATTTVTRTATAPGGSAQNGSGGVGLSVGATTPVGSQGATPCRASGLALSFLGQQGATGHGELGFALRNITAGHCTTVGYPGVQFLNGALAPLPTTPTHTTSDFFGHTQLRTLTVAPGQSVSFRLGVTHGEGSSAGCSTAGALQVIAPNDTATLRTAIPDGAAECTTVTVSPLVAGEAAYP
jgi:uncharacterized protein DUF4232